MKKFITLFLISFISLGVSHVRAEGTLLSQVERLHSQMKREKNHLVDQCVMNSLLGALEVLIAPTIFGAIPLLIDALDYGPIRDADRYRREANSYHMALEQLNAARHLLMTVEKVFFVRLKYGSFERVSEGDWSVLSQFQLPGEDLTQTVDRLHEANLKGSPELDQCTKEVAERSCNITSACLARSGERRWDAPPPLDPQK